MISFKRIFGSGPIPIGRKAADGASERRKQRNADTDTGRRRQHTPGEWTLEDAFSPHRLALYSRVRRHNLAMLFVETEEDRANALLMKASPLLLEACEKAMRRFIELEAGEPGSPNADVLCELLYALDVAKEPLP